MFVALFYMAISWQASTFFDLICRVEWIGEALMRLSEKMDLIQFKGIVYKAFTSTILAQVITNTWGELCPVDYWPGDWAKQNKIYAFTCACVICAFYMHSACRPQPENRGYALSSAIRTLAGGSLVVIHSPSVILYYRFLHLNCLNHWISTKYT